MRVAGVLVTVLVGCYHPDAPTNAPCGPNDVCPSGQSCIAGSCGGSSTRDDAPVPGDDATSTDDAFVGSDAPGGLCAGGDGICRVSCVDTDPDCMTTCGDARCVGNAGELCGNCTADCATLTPVCGNGACDPGESPDCYADCGPTPWMWDALEATLVSEINERRATGFACPNGALPAVPALTPLAAFTPTVREWVWELAHHNVVTSNGGACNGRSNADRQTPADFDAYVISRGYASPDAAIAAWFASATICPSLMSAVRTQIGVGVAFDVAKAYVVILE